MIGLLVAHSLMSRRRVLSVVVVGAQTIPLFALHARCDIFANFLDIPKFAVTPIFLQFQSYLFQPYIQLWLTYLRFSLTLGSFRYHNVIFRVRSGNCIIANLFSRFSSDLMFAAFCDAR